jgi:hypothetical protein
MLTEIRHLRYDVGSDQSEIKNEFEYHQTHDDLDHQNRDFMIDDKEYYIDSENLFQINREQTIGKQLDKDSFVQEIIRNGRYFIIGERQFC